MQLRDSEQLPDCRGCGDVAVELSSPGAGAGLEVEQLEGSGGGGGAVCAGGAAGGSG